MTYVRALVGFVTLLGCNCTADVTNIDEPVSAVQSHLSSIAPWKAITGRTLAAAPAFAKGNTTWTAVALGTDTLMYLAHELSTTGGNWSSWTLASPTSTAFTSPPAMLALPQAGRFLIVARNSDGRFAASVQNQTGFVYVAWTAISSMTFATAPSIAFNRSPNVAPSNTAIIVGKGADGLIYESRNLLSGGNYNPANWTGFSPIGTDTFLSQASIVDTCAQTSGVPSFIVSAMKLDGSYFYASLNGTWSAWSLVVNGLFLTGPALTTSCGTGGVETVVFGLGTDKRIWSSTQLSGGYAGFTPISDQTFVQASISAGYSLGVVRLGGMPPSSQLPLTTYALSP